MKFSKLKNAHRWIRIQELLRNNRHWVVFILFATTLFLKNVMFHSMTYSLISFSTTWKHPLDFILFYMPKLMPAFFLASIALLTKRYWWTYIACFLIDLWIIANLFYLKSSAKLLTLDEILIVHNLRGYEQSLAALYSNNVLLIPLTTLVYIIAVLITHTQSHIRRQPKTFILTIFILELPSPYRYFYDNRADDPWWVGAPPTKFMV